MAMTLAELDAPAKLAAAWEADRISGWDAVIVLLHRVDRRSVDDWTAGLPDDLLDLVSQEVERLALSPGGEPIGRGACLDVNPEALGALLTWLYSSPPLAA